MEWYRGYGRRRSDTSVEDDFEFEEKWDKNEDIPEVCRLPEPTDVLTPTECSEDVEETSGGDAFNVDSSGEEPSTPVTRTVTPTEPSRSPVQRERYFTCDQLPDVTSAPRDIKPRSKRSLRKYYRSLREDREEEEEHSREERERTIPSWIYKDKTEQPRHRSHRTWKPDCSEPEKHKETSPFYYHVPQNPAAVNVLPPGSYLVIPQNKLSDSPLKVYEHPQEQSTEPSSEGTPSRPCHHSRRNKVRDHDNAEANYEGSEESSDEYMEKGNERRRRGPRGSDEEEHKDVSAASHEADGVRTDTANVSGTTEDEDDSDDEEGNSRPTLVDFVSALSYTPTKDHTNPNVDESSDVEVLTFDFVSFIKRRLPFCDLDEIREEWKRKNYKGWRDFVDAVREYKMSEMVENVTPHLPFADEVLLKRELRAIMNSQTSPEELYEAIREMLRVKEIYGFKERESYSDISNDSTEGSSGERTDNIQRNVTAAKKKERHSRKRVRGSRHTSRSKSLKLDG